MGTKDQSESLERAIDQMSRKTRDLRRQLRKAVVDHISDRYVHVTIYFCHLLKTINLRITPHSKFYYK